MSEWLSSAPIWVANVITVVLFVLIAGACFLVPRRLVMADAPDQAVWRDIRWWALILIVIQLFIYAIFS